MKEKIVNLKNVYFSAGFHYEMLLEVLKKKKLYQKNNKSFADAEKKYFLLTRYFDTRKHKISRYISYIYYLINLTYIIFKIKK